MKRLSPRRVLALIGLGAALLFLRGCVVRPANDFPGSTFNRGKNAVWLGIEWVNSPHSQPEIALILNSPGPLPPRPI